MVAMITGAGSGIGRSTAIELCRNGWTIVLAGRSKDRLLETAEFAASGDTLIVPADVTREQSVEKLFAHTISEFGRLDLLFNNAGINVHDIPLENLTTEQWQSVVDVNLTGVFLCTRAAFRIMKSQDPQGGRIINNGSISAQVPRPLSAVYTATKHAVTGLTKSTSLDGRQYNIACGQIDVGNAATDLSERMAAGTLQASGQRMCEPRMNVENVARAVVYMAGLPLDANVPFLTVMATNMPLVGRG